MHTGLIVKHFQQIRPDLNILDAVVDGDERREFTIRKRDAVSAIAGDPCQCAVALGCRRSTTAAEALILTTVAYLLEPAGRGKYQAVKYLHDGQQVVKNTDAGGLPVWNTIVTLRPPSQWRRVGVQTPQQKAAQPKSVRQTAEHVARRVASAKTNPARRRVARVGAAA